MSQEEISIRTRDGACRAFVSTPDGPEAGTGPWPAVIFFMDGLGIRPALLAMGERLSKAGYAVLTPDMFYRAGPYAPIDPKAVFASGDVRGAIGHLMGTTDNQKAMSDVEAFIAYLGARKDVAGEKIGTTGYCMGGGMSLTAAGTFPDRIAAAASFHGGSLATDAPSSPHLLAPRMKARIYVAGADKDDSYPPEMAARLEKAMSDAGVAHRCEIYENALHGWTMTDFPIYEPASAERHWTELLALFAATLH